MKDKLQEAAEIHANNTFQPKRNKDGEIVTTPPGQTVQHGYTKHSKVAIKHFMAGAQYQSEIDKEAIQDLVSALEVAKNYLKKEGLHIVSEELESIIQKHKQ